MNRCDWCGGFIDNGYQCDCKPYDVWMDTGSLLPRAKIVYAKSPSSAAKRYAQWYDTAGLMPYLGTYPGLAVTVKDECGQVRRFSITGETQRIYNAILEA